jgi:FAD/FMN-containing dehydrogenase
MQSASANHVVSTDASVHRGESSRVHHPTPETTLDGIQVNDHHSKLNETRVHRVEYPDSVEALRESLLQATAEGHSVSIAGGRHAMGGQQFGAGTVHLDMSGMNRVLSFDPREGLIEVEAGICWPELLGYLADQQRECWPQWGIRQKQTGADQLSIGGALSANAHGRGLSFKPMIDDVESFTLMNAEGRVLSCRRNENSELFSLAIGGYGLFGIIGQNFRRLPVRRLPVCHRP